MEKDKPGSLDLKRMAEYGLKPGPIYGRLKRGESIDLEDGRVLTPADVLGAPKKGRVVTILGDTRPCANVLPLAEQADLLVHEATFLHELHETAHNYHHSTALQAAEAARDAGAKEAHYYALQLTLQGYGAPAASIGGSQVTLSKNAAGRRIGAVSGDPPRRLVKT